MLALYCVCTCLAVNHSAYVLCADVVPAQGNHTDLILRPGHCVAHSTDGNPVLYQGILLPPYPRLAFDVPSGTAAEPGLQPWSKDGLATCGSTSTSHQGSETVNCHIFELKTPRHLRGPCTMRAHAELFGSSADTFAFGPRLSTDVHPVLGRVGSSPRGCCA